MASAAAAAVRLILEEAASANTKRSYASALRYWHAWHLARFGEALALPVPEATVIQFIVDHLAHNDRGHLRIELPPAIDQVLVAAGMKGKPGPLALATVVHRVAVLSSLHTLRSSENPCEAPAVRHLLSRSRRACAKRGERPRKKTAITADILRAMLATCDDSLLGLRDAALLTFGFATGGRRRSEIASATYENLRRAGDDAYTYFLGHGKTLQAGPSAGSTPDKPLFGLAADAMTAWLDASKISQGPLFRSLSNGQLGTRPLSTQAVNNIVQSRARQAGLEGDFGGHSLRSGFATEAGLSGVSLQETMQLTDHRSVASVIGYFQMGSLIHSQASRLLE
ncbi:MAG: site-specific integrase [Xanthomonadales bacterium]|nr:site-specific integrase [Xanthomonadales bacterium]